MHPMQVMHRINEVQMKRIKQMYVPAGIWEYPEVQAITKKMGLGGFGLLMLFLEKIFLKEGERAELPIDALIAAVSEVHDVPVEKVDELVDLGVAYGALKVDGNFLYSPLIKAVWEEVADE